MNAYFGHYHEVKAISEACKKNGILFFLDLAHAIGATPINVKELKVDAAFFCCYKYLCGGPGATAAIFINSDYHKDLSPGLRGWFGTDRTVLSL